MPATLPRSIYADMFGPTTGDRICLADTELIIEVERDFTTYGEEVTLVALFGNREAYGFRGLVMGKV